MKGHAKEQNNISGNTTEIHFLCLSKIQNSINTKGGCALLVISLLCLKCQGLVRNHYEKMELCETRRDRCFPSTVLWLSQTTSLAFPGVNSSQFFSFSSSLLYIWSNTCSSFDSSLLTSSLVLSFCWLWAGHTGINDIKAACVLPLKQQKILLFSSSTLMHFSRLLFIWLLFIQSNWQCMHNILSVH